MKKVLFAASQINGNGGIPRFNRNLIKAIREDENCELTVISLNDDGEYDWGYGLNKNKLKFLLTLLKEMVFSSKDLTIIGLLNFAPISIFSRLRKNRIVVILHGIEAWYNRGKLTSFFKNIDEFWAVSSYTKRKFASENKVSEDKVKRIFNTLPSDWTRTGELPVYKPFFFSVTRLAADEGYKGIDKTIEVVSELQSLIREKKWQYVIVGSGDDLERHMTLAKDLNVEDLVDFRTNITDEELQQLYSQCSFFVLPSTGEGFGIVYLEAMASKKACIGCLNCGAEDVIENQQTGFLLEQNVEEIKVAIEKFILDTDMPKSMGEKGYHKLISEFTFDKFQYKIQSLL